ncbi:MAG: DUF2273 domain-containing protein [Rubrobacter sp.]|nr:DUF2273 domain-containing protein [Rubrobacter sp.]
MYDQPERDYGQENRFSLSSRHWGAIIGVVLIVLIASVGPGFTALAILAGVIGYFAGKFLDGEISSEEIRERTQGRTRNPVR